MLYGLGGIDLSEVLGSMYQQAAPKREPVQHSGRLNNPGGHKTYGGADTGQNNHPQGVHDKSGKLQNNGLHGVDITVNDWTHKNGSISGFDHFSAQMQALEPIRGTAAAEKQIRSMLDNAGFSYTDSQIAYWLAKKGGGHGGGGSSGGGSSGEEYLGEIDRIKKTPRDAISEPASGLEDTVNIRNNTDVVRPLDEEDDTVLTVRADAPQERVVDPVTGKTFKSPAEARKAGITNWVYEHEYKA